MKKLSGNNSTIKLAIPIFFLGFFIVTISIALQEKTGLMFLVIATISFLGYIFIKFQYRNSYNVFYNSANLFLKYPQKERQIPFVKILKVKLGLSDVKILGFKYYEYNIDFLNESGKQETINLFISSLSDNLENFQNLLKQVSPSTKIENYT